MTSILFLTEEIDCKIFRCIDLRKEKSFLNFFLHFLNLESILNIFKKNYAHSWCIFELRDSEKRG